MFKGTFANMTSQLEVSIRKDSPFIVSTGDDSYKFKPEGVYKRNADGSYNCPVRYMKAGQSRNPGEGSKTDYLPFQVVLNDKSKIKTVAVKDCYIENLGRSAVKSKNGLGAWQSFIRMGLPKDMVDHIVELMNEPRNKVKVETKSRWTPKGEAYWGTTSIKTDPRHPERFIVHKKTSTGTVEMTATKLADTLASHGASARGTAILVVSATRSNTPGSKNKGPYTLQVRCVSMNLAEYTQVHGNSVAVSSGLMDEVEDEFQETDQDESEDETEDETESEESDTDSDRAKRKKKTKVVAAFKKKGKRESKESESDTSASTSASESASSSEDEGEAKSEAAAKSKKKANDEDKSKNTAKGKDADKAENKSKPKDSDASTSTAARPPANMDEFEALVTHGLANMGEDKSAIKALVSDETKTRFGAKVPAKFKDQSVPLAKNKDESKVKAAMVDTISNVVKHVSQSPVKSKAVQEAMPVIKAASTIGDRLKCEDTVKDMFKALAEMVITDVPKSPNKSKPTDKDAAKNEVK